MNSLVSRNLNAIFEFLNNLLHDAYIFENKTKNKQKTNKQTNKQTKNKQTNKTKTTVDYFGLRCSSSLKRANMFLLLF